MLKCCCLSGQINRKDIKIYWTNETRIVGNRPVSRFSIDLFYLHFVRCNKFLFHASPNLFSFLLKSIFVWWKKIPAFTFYSELFWKHWIGLSLTDDRWDWIIIDDFVSLSFSVNGVIATVDVGKRCAKIEI